MNIVISDKLDKLTKLYNELEFISEKPTLTGRERERRNELLAMQAILRTDITATTDELRNWQRNRLFAQAGLRPWEVAKLGRLPDDIEEEYRNFGLGRDVPKHCLPPDYYERAQAISGEAGTQAISYSQPSAGGTFVAPQAFQRVLATAKQYDEIFDEAYSNIIETDKAGVLPVPSLDDVAEVASVVSEAVQSSDPVINGLTPPINYGQIQLNAWTLRSTQIRVSRELFQDSGYPIGKLLEYAFAMQLARGGGQYLATGTGVNQPTGLLTGAAAAGCPVVILTGDSGNNGSSDTGANSVGTVDLTTIKYKLNRAYRWNACWYMNDSTLQAIEALLDKVGRPIVKFSEGLNSRGSGTAYILGHPVAVCPSFPSLGNHTSPIIFGSPTYFVQRRVPASFYLKRLDERFADFDEVAFQAYWRIDSNVAVPNTSFPPFVIGQCHS